MQNIPVWGIQRSVEGILAIIMTLGMPIFIVGIVKYFGFKKAKLELEAHRNPDQQKQLEALKNERALLEERVQNLETIVCSVDLELNARLNKLAEHQSFLALAPAKKNERQISASQNNDPSRAATIIAQASGGQLTVGSTLMGGRFQVQELVGKGGMGAVYVANDTQIGERVALKVIGGNLSEDPEAVERFRREASSARKVTHPNVIRIHDLGDDSGLLFLSMEYFPSITLAEMLRRRQMLQFDEAREILSQVCKALIAAHGVGVFHRDLKPQNILVNDQRDVRVIDFGLAKASYMRGMTATGMILGTPEYMAPEQVRGGHIDHRTDIYSLGVTAYHMLCGRPPFVADTPIAVGFKQCNETPRPPREIKSDLPISMENAILRCLEKEPTARFDKVDDFLAVLGSTI